VTDGQQEPMFGQARNGDRVHVAFPNYEGMAGFRPKGDQFEVAYFGDSPGRTFPIDGTVDGRAVRAVQRANSVSGKAVVLIVEFT